MTSAGKEAAAAAEEAAGPKKKKKTRGEAKQMKRDEWKAAEKECAPPESALPCHPSAITHTAAPPPRTSRR